MLSSSRATPFLNSQQDNIDIAQMCKTCPVPTQWDKYALGCTFCLGTTEMTKMPECPSQFLILEWDSLLETVTVTVVSKGS